MPENQKSYGAQYYCMCLDEKRFFYIGSVAIQMFQILNTGMVCNRLTAANTVLPY